VAYNPDWTDGDRVAVGDHARLTYLRELTEAVNRRFNVLYAPAVDYSAYTGGGFIRPQICAGSLVTPPHLRLAVTERIISHGRAGCLGGSPASPSSMKWLWPEAGADFGKEISYAVTPPEGKVSIWSYLGSEVPGGGGFTDPFLTGERKFIRAKHVNELRQVLEWLRYGRWEMPWYMAAGMHSWWPDTPWWGDIVANDGSDEVRILGMASVRLDQCWPYPAGDLRGLVDATVTGGWFDIAADVDGSWPPDPDVSATIGLYRCTKRVPFEMEDGPSWNNWCNASAWSTPGGLGDCELIGSLSVPHSHRDWPVFYRLSAGSAAFQAMVNGSPNVILARRMDTGPEAVLVQVRCGIEFELNGPAS